MTKPLKTSSKYKMFCKIEKKMGKKKIQIFFSKRKKIWDAYFNLKVVG